MNDLQKFPKFMRDGFKQEEKMTRDDIIRMAREGAPSTSTGRAFIDCYYGETDE